MKKKLVIVLIGIIIVIAILAMLLYMKPAKQKTKTDAKKFADEYTQVGENNLFVYRSASEIIKILKNGTGVVYLGFPECNWCQAYVKYLDEVAQEVGISKIYYYNILKDRENNTKEYQEMVSLLSGHLQYDDEGNERIYVPNVSFHVEGKLIANDYESSKDTHNLKEPKDYWTEEEVSDLKTTLKKYMEEVYKAESMCSDCNR